MASDPILEEAGRLFRMVRDRLQAGRLTFGEFRSELERFALATQARALRDVALEIITTTALPEWFEGKRVAVDMIRRRADLLAPPPAPDPEPCDPLKAMRTEHGCYAGYTFVGSKAGEIPWVRCTTCAKPDGADDTPAPGSQGARCPECGPLKRVDEEGCCLSCGRYSMWFVPPSLERANAERRRAREDLTDAGEAYALVAEGWLRAHGIDPDADDAPYGPSDWPACEGCEAPARHSDAEGTYLCGSCWDGLVASAREEGADA